jgi:hypothetical protein
MSKRELPSLQLLKELFLPDYQEGIIYWNQRPEHHFCSEKKQQQWNKKYSAKQVGTLDKRSGYWMLTVNKQIYSQHRILFAMYHEIEIGDLVIDHINRDKADNRISNLRLCTLSDNSCNAKVPKNNLSTGIKNITKTKQDRFLVSICKNYKKKTKVLRTLSDAINWRNQNIVGMHGEFTCI